MEIKIGRDNRRGK